MKKLVVMVAALAAFYGCAGGQKSEKSESLEVETESVKAPEAEEIVNTTIFGVYEGTLPAASSPGIKTRLTLNKDNSFELRSEYIDEKDGIFNDKGAFTIDENILTATQDDGTVYYYRIEDGKLRMLNGDKEEITGDHAENYLLNQTEKF